MKYKSEGEIFFYCACLVCCVLRRLGWSNSVNIARIAGVKRLKFADEMAKCGLLRKHKRGRYSSKSIFVLSELGREIADHVLHRSGFLLSQPSRYKLTGRGDLSDKNQIHDLAGQELLLKIAGEKLNDFRMWVTESDERRNKGEPSCADLVEYFLETPQPGRFGQSKFTRLHEVESSIKFGSQLIYFLRLRVDRLLGLGEGHACCCIWSPSDKIIETYGEALKKPLPKYYRTHSGELAIDQSKPCVRAESWMFQFFKLELDQRGALHPRREDISKLKG
jgi:hypothetical protein